MLNNDEHVRRRGVRSERGPRRVDFLGSLVAFTFSMSVEQLTAVMCNGVASAMVNVADWHVYILNDWSKTRTVGNEGTRRFLELAFVIRFLDI